MSLTFKIFKKYPYLKYGFSKKLDGPMKIDPLNLNCLKNRKDYFKKFDISYDKTVFPVQSHSCVVTKISKKNESNIQADALITELADLYLTVTASDCFPIYLFDPIKKVVGIVHSGWRGSVNGILKNTIEKMGSDPINTLVGIGPGIQKCHFEVKEDVKSKFLKYPKAIVNKKGKLYINIPSVIITQLKMLGVPSKNIEQSSDCTYCKVNKYYSFRRDKPAIVQPMLGFIGIAKTP